MNERTARKKIEKEFDKRLDGVWMSESLDGLLFRIKAPGTRTECGFRIQIEIYQVLDGPVTNRQGDFHHVKYVDYFKADYNPKTMELPEFFLSLGEKLLKYAKKE